MGALWPAGYAYDTGALSLRSRVCFHPSADPSHRECYQERSKRILTGRTGIETVKHRFVVLRVDQHECASFALLNT